MNRLTDALVINGASLWGVLINLADDNIHRECILMLLLTLQLSLMMEGCELKKLGENVLYCLMIMYLN